MRRYGGIRSDQRRVVLQAAGEGVAEPIQFEVRAERSGKMVEIALRQQHRHAVRRFMFLYQLILRQEIASFGASLAQPYAVAMSACGQQGVVAGGAQVAAQPAQHFIAQEVGQVAHAAILLHNTVGQE